MNFEDVSAKLDKWGVSIGHLIDERDELREILHDLVMLRGEAHAIGGGPGFKDREAKAWRRAEELFEP